MHGLTSSYVITTLVTPPASSQLTTLANVKDELDLTSIDTSNDNRLTRFITEESDGIARYCNRVFGYATWQDEFRPQRGVRGEGVRGAVNPLKLTKWPLTSAAGVESVVETIAGVSTTLVAGTDFEIDTGSLLPGDEGNSFLYRLDDSGNPRTWPGVKIVVIYQAGYALPNDAAQGIPTIPSNLESACIRLVVWRFKAKNRDPMLRARDQPNIGSEQYWVGATPGNSSPYPNEIMSILNNYRPPVMA
jgi:hypothetical protein